MKRRLRAFTLPGPAGPLEALLEEFPERTPAFAAVVCHPHPLYGGTLHNKVVHMVSATLADMGGVTLRFNFRGVGKSAGAYDEGAGEREDARAALRYLRERQPGAPLWMAGFSFGAGIAAAVAVEESDVDRLVLVAPPVTRADFSPLRAWSRPKLVIQGEADQVCPPDRLHPDFGAWAEPKRLILVRGANHFFDRHLGDLSRALREHLSAAGPAGAG